MTRIGPYSMTRELGRGGMGVVYLAHDERLGRDVAIKALPDELSRDPDRMARFEREAKIVASLNHPGIAAVHALEEHDGRRFLVMEFVEGETLAARLERAGGRGLRLDETLEIAERIAAALEAAHDKGVVHRDLKPGNVMLTPDGRVKVLDFGLARQADSEPISSASVANSPTITNPAYAHSPTIPGAIMGTAGYMSPEQARGRQVDRRSDIFSLGCVVYEMLAGCRAFGGETVSDHLAALLAQPPEWNALPATVGPALRRVLARCLEKDPARRYRDVGDAAHDLAEAVVADADAETTPAGASSSSVRTARRLAIGGLAAALAASAVAVGFWLRARDAPPPPIFSQLTRSVEFINNARFAPDGRAVVFSASRERKISELFVLRPEDLEPRKLGDDQVQLLAVSSTGELAVLVRAQYMYHRTYVGTLARMPLTDAPPREVLEVVTAADWSPDGSELAVIRLAGEISRLEHPIGTVLAESTGYLSDLRISPDGERLAFMSHDLASDDRGRLLIVDRAGAVVARSPEYESLEGLAWSPDGRRVLYSALGSHGDYQVWSLALDGTVRSTLTGAAELIAHDAHPNGRLLVSTEAVTNGLVARLAGETIERETPSLVALYPKAIARDGSSVAFTEEATTSSTVYNVLYQSAPGAPAVRLGEGAALEISPDGRWVVAARLDVPPRLMMYPVGAGAPRDISVDGVTAYTKARFLSDGARLLLSAAEAGKRPRCHLLDLTDGTVRPVTPEGTFEGTISPDDLRICAGRMGVGWFIFELDGGAERRLPGITYAEWVLGWSADGEGLHVMSGSADPSPRIDRYDIATGERTPLLPLDAGRAAGSVWTVELAPDGAAYAYAHRRAQSVLYGVDGVR